MYRYGLSVALLALATCQAERLFGAPPPPALAQAEGAGDGRTGSEASRARPGIIFRDCRHCPEMVVIPSGRFLMGSPESESGRGGDEGPQAAITISQPFAAGRFEITRDQYERFLRAARHPVSGGCITDRRRKGDWRPDEATTYRDPGYRQAGRHPVVCVSWSDSNAYVRWLSLRSGRAYRLLSEAEWEYAARAGSAAPYPWGSDPALGCRFANGTDLTARKKYFDLDYVDAFGTCDDHKLNTAPVGSYRPNRFGLFDMIGNVGEWTSSCSTKSYAAPAEGEGTATGQCPRRVVRGGSWGTVVRQLRSAERVNQPASDRDDSIGIRVARDLE